MIGNMPRVYDNWERLVESTLDRERLRQLALCDSLSSGSSSESDSISRTRFDYPDTRLPGRPISSLVEKSFADFKLSNQSVEARPSQVYVNGHFIPHLAVKKAEKLAGRIRPGAYWYDFRAGFWGGMGHPCLGIIMPNIEEFNYPMPEKCSAGNTEIFVNGRELNQKDLDLLARRGLPITRDRSYIIEISGKVIDEDTGEELDGLGKLAPTVERLNRGFGMEVP